MTREYAIIDRDNEMLAARGLKSVEEAEEKVRKILPALDGGWKIVNFTTGRTVETDQTVFWRR